MISLNFRLRSKQQTAPTLLPNPLAQLPNLTPETQSASLFTMNFLDAFPKVLALASITLTARLSTRPIVCTPAHRANARQTQFSTKQANTGLTKSPLQRLRPRKSLSIPSTTVTTSTSRASSQSRTGNGSLALLPTQRLKLTMIAFSMKTLATTLILIFSVKHQENGDLSALRQT